MSSSSSPPPSLLGGCTSASHSSFFLTSTPTYRVHPLVVFSVLDHYQRRNDGQARVVGTLLGSVENGVVEVKQAFPVPHEEEEEAATVHMDYHHSMLALHKQVSPRDVVVGWYSTAGEGPALNYITSLMHEVYRAQSGGAAEPLHLSVDVSMRGGMKVSGFVNSVVRNKAAAGSAATAGAELLSNFQPVPVQLYAYDEENIGVDALLSGVPDDDARLDAPATFLTEAEQTEVAALKLLECMESLEAYVDAVAAGKIAQPDGQLGVQLHQLLASLPALDSASFTSAFGGHVQDLLSVVYLANMTKAQLAIADKANTMVV